MPSHALYLLVILFAGISAGLYVLNRRIKARMARIENQLLETQRVMQCAENLAQVGRWQMDPKTMTLTWAEETYRLHGYHPGEVTPSFELVQQLIYTEDWPNVVETLHVGLESREAQVCECRITRPDGAVRYLRVSGTFDKEPHGGKEQVIGAIQDITPLHRTEEALRQSAERYRNILESIEEGYYEIDRKGCLVFFNLAMQRLLGYSPPEMLRMHYSVYLEATTIRQAKEVFRAALESKKVHTFTGKVRRKEGAELYVETSISPIFNALGQATGFRGVARDVTARVCAEESQRQMEEQMWYTQKLESLGVLAGGIAHDFNNLLTVILGNAEFVSEELPEKGSARTSLTHMIQAGARAAELARQMLAYSGRGFFEVRRIYIADLIQDIGNLLAASISKKVLMTFAMGEAIPPIQADASQIRQVIMNLITNAAEAIGDKEGEVRVSTRLETIEPGILEGSPLKLPMDGGEYVVLEVADNGCGMSTEVMERMFDPFFTTKFTGRGLGLSVVLGIIRGHHGGLQVLSELGAGTVFRAYLPASLDESPNDAARRGLEEEDLWQGDGALLLADDEDAVRELNEHILTQHGFTVVAVADGVTAVEAFREDPQRFRVVVLDMTMPGKNGQETLLEIRGLEPKIPALIVSGYSEEETMRRFGRFERVRFLQKPYSRVQLIESVRELVRAAAAEKKAAVDTNA